MKRCTPISDEPPGNETAKLPGNPTLLANERVRLREFRHDEAHYELIRSVAGDALIPLITTVPTTPTDNEAAAYVERQFSRQRTGSGYSFAIADDLTDRPVGQIGLWTADLASGRATTGYWVAPQYRKRGYVTSALRALSSWAFSIADVQRISLYVEPWNEGSWRAAERVGYLREGLLRSWELVGEERKDVFAYGLVRPKSG